MKPLGITQLEQKKHELLPKLAGFEELLGDLQKYFMGIVYGDPGQGKTEFCFQLARALCNHFDVSWLSYEQGHSYSLKQAALRQDFKSAKKTIRFINPIDKTKEVDYYAELLAYLDKKSTPPFVFIDSLNYVDMSVAQYKQLVRMVGHKRSVIFISHAKGKKPDTKTGEKINYDGEIGIFVKNYIAQVSKNRGSAYNPYVIWEKRAKELNPTLFAKIDTAKNGRRRGRPRKNSQS